MSKAQAGCGVEDHAERMAEDVTRLFNERLEAFYERLKAAYDAASKAELAALVMAHRSSIDRVMVMIGAVVNAIEQGTAGPANVHAACMQMMMLGRDSWAGPEAEFFGDMTAFLRSMAATERQFAAAERKGATIQ